MKKFLMPALLTLSMVLVLPLVTACGSDDDKDDDAPPADDANNDEEQPAPTMTGFWTGTFNSGVGLTLDLTETGDMLTGDYANENGATGSASGTIEGNEVSLTVNTVAPATTALFQGTVNDARTSMGGNYTIIAGGGGGGTWQVSK